MGGSAIVIILEFFYNFFGILASENKSSMMATARVLMLAASLLKFIQVGGALHYITNNTDRTMKNMHAHSKLSGTVTIFATLILCGLYYIATTHENLVNSHLSQLSDPKHLATAAGMLQTLYHCKLYLLFQFVHICVTVYMFFSYTTQERTEAKRVIDRDAL